LGHFSFALFLFNLVGKETTETACLSQSPRAEQKLTTKFNYRRKSADKKKKKILSPRRVDPQSTEFLYR